jgi:hypothetical protein
MHIFMHFNSNIVLTIVKYFVYVTCPLNEREIFV